MRRKVVGLLMAIGLVAVLVAASACIPRKSHSSYQPDKYYRINTKSRTFHKPGCRYYYCKNCRSGFHSRNAAISAGYRPCKVCKP